MTFAFKTLFWLGCLWSLIGGIHARINSGRKRVCKGVRNRSFISAKNINRFINCTTVKGNLRIMTSTFTGKLHKNIPPLTMADLNIFKSVQEITGNVVIQSTDRSVTDLSFLSSLEVIHGKETWSGNALSILMTPLKILELTSLKSIQRGDVSIIGNRHLCLVNSLNWKKILAKPTQRFHVAENRLESSCVADNIVCDSRCSKDGCWGVGPDKCFACATYTLDDQHMCLNSCSDLPDLYEDGLNTCKMCDPQLDRNRCKTPDPVVGKTSEENSVTDAKQKEDVAKMPDSTEKEKKIGITSGLLTGLRSGARVCSGLSMGLSMRGNAEFRYNYYVKTYSNCTYVDGNLELQFLDENPEYDLSFLRDIQEVTGYVLIVAVHSSNLPLENLKIIRGNTLFSHKGEAYSLFVALNFEPNSTTVGLKELRFTSLQEILKGKVLFQNNILLCFENTIDWSDINPSVKSPVHYHHDSQYSKRQCGECDPACYQKTTGQRHCWGTGPNMCQKLTEGDECYGVCDRRCNERTCCHPQCAAGCTGPKQTDCLACRNFNDDGACVQYCPPSHIYNPALFRLTRNPNVKYAYGPVCVSECPENMLHDSGACVQQCPEGKKESVSNTCEVCQGKCDGVCKGFEEDGFVSASNIKSFANCTSIIGNLRILSLTLRGDTFYNIPPMKPADLNVFKQVKEITGYVMIQADDKDFTDLSFLSSLEVIHGRETRENNVLEICKTSLKSLGLTSLKSIKAGDVSIVGNPGLCLVDSLNWRLMFFSPTQKIHTYENGIRSSCDADGIMCDSRCTNDGCWGIGPDKCLRCTSYVLEGQNLCLDSCDDLPLLYQSDFRTCRKCHSQCEGSCSGPENSDCERCLNFAIIHPNNTKTCFEECPDSTFLDIDNICRPCEGNCDSDKVLYVLKLSHKYMASLMLKFNKLVKLLMQ